MAKFSYRPMAVVVLIFLVVGELTASLAKMMIEVSFAQVVALYNSQLYFKPSLQPLEVPTEIHDDRGVPEPGVPGGPVQEGAANAVMLMLARNSELEGAVRSMIQLERTFNQRYHYPWVFLNEEPFTGEFKQ